MCICYCSASCCIYSRNSSKSVILSRRNFVKVRRWAQHKSASLLAREVLVLRAGYDIMSPGCRGAEKSPRPGHIGSLGHSNASKHKGIAFMKEGYKVPAYQTLESPPLAVQTTLLPALLCITNNHSAILNFTKPGRVV